MKVCTGLAQICLVVVGGVAGPAPVHGEIHLEWRRDTQTVVMGDTVRIGCYAVSSDAEQSQFLSAIDLIFAWNPGVLKFLGVNDAGGAALLSSGFPVDPFGLNDAIPPQSGDGLYQALANLGSSVEATPAGTLITTFEFMVIAELATTEVVMLPDGGSPLTKTSVWDATVANTSVTGTLGTATVQVVALGDFDGDGTPDSDDHAAFSRCITGPGRAAGEGCSVGDFDGDGDVDTEDWAGFANAFMGSG